LLFVESVVKINIQNVFV